MDRGDNMISRVATFLLNAQFKRGWGPEHEASRDRENYSLHIMLKIKYLTKTVLEEAQTLSIISLNRSKHISKKFYELRDISSGI